MPNIKSAIKRVKVTEKKNMENKIVKSKLNTQTKKFKAAVAEKNVEVAQKELVALVAMLDNAAAKNVIHENCANRRKARNTKLLESLKA